MHVQMEELIFDYDLTHKTGDVFYDLIHTHSTSMQYYFWLPIFHRAVSDHRLESGENLKPAIDRHHKST